MLCEHSRNPKTVLLGCTDQHIVAVSQANHVAVLSANPFANEAHDEWSQDGKRLDVSLRWLEVPIAKTELPLEVRKEASKNRGPFNVMALG